MSADDFSMCVENYLGTKRWYDAPGHLHRSDGPAVVCHTGTKQWWMNGRLHRLDGPAIEWADGQKEWFIDGKRHRLDGPAIELSRSWFVDKYFVDDNECKTQEQFRRAVIMFLLDCSRDVADELGRLFGESA